MIAVQEAKRLIKEHVKVQKTIQLDLASALGFTLAHDVYASVDLPPFTQSAMDGYAFKYQSDFAGRAYQCIGTITAGIASDMVVNPGQAVRIFTGAALPSDVDTVVMQEKTTISNNQLSIAIDDYPVYGMHVRKKGEEINAGDVLIQKGSTLNVGSIGLLASAGIAMVQVYAKPRIAIIVTGNELVDLDQTLQLGQIYESNSFLIKAYLHKMGIQDVACFKALDDLNTLSQLIKTTLDSVDMLLITGGVSVGAYDFVKQACIDQDAEIIFHKVSQKPGKPLLFGKKDQKIIFGLPGNPASVLTCLYQYVGLAIQFMAGNINNLTPLEYPLRYDYKKTVGLTHFLKAHFDGQYVDILTGQESSKLTSYAKANGIVQIDAEVSFVPARGNVPFYFI